MGELRLCCPLSFQLSMKGPPGPVGLTGRPGPVVSIEAVCKGDTSVERGTYSNGITPSLLPRVSLGMQVRKERWEKWGHR